MRRIAPALLIALAAWIIAREPRTADACGGCFAPADVQTAVDSHRMAIAIGTDETTLWDQIVYSGEPSDFVWVLPIPTAAVQVELADPEFFDALDGGTAPTVFPTSPAPVCPDAFDEDGCGDGTDIQDFGGYGGSPGDSVTIYDLGMVGPYETLTIGSEDTQELYTWLNDNGYDVPLVYYSTLDHYIDQGYLFMVLRLAPGQDTTAMTPVRIHYPGAMTTFPLKMVTVGSKGIVNLSLWVFAEQRYEARNYGTIQIDPEQLSWDWAANRSSYRELYESTVEEAGNRAWVVEYAAPVYDGAVGDPSLFPVFLPADDYAQVLDAVRQPYVTRLRTSILNAHIDQDLQLAVSADPADISNVLFAPNDVNYRQLQCPGEGIGCRVGRGQSVRAFVSFVIMFGAAAVFWRRRRRRDGTDRT